MFKKIFLVSAFCFNLAFGGFDSMIHSQRGEEVLEIFDIEPSFLNNEHFLDVKNSFFSGKKKIYTLKRFEEGYEFIPTLKEMLLKEGIPQEFLYLAMVESEFSLQAKSRKKAVGLWQFMPRTAKHMGLDINSQIDERKDPIRSTQAAIAYLKSLKQTFGKWYLAAIAYNCGETRLKKAITLANSDSLSVLLDPEAKYIPLESRVYIRKILSVSLLMHNVNTLEAKDYDYFLNRGASSLVAKVNTAPGTPLANIAKEAGLSLKELKKYNPHFKRNITPTYAKVANIYMPYQFLAKYQEKNEGKKINLTAKPYLVHRVNKGETISSISKRYGISIAKIKNYNALKNAHLLSINQEILIPLG